MKSSKSICFCLFLLSFSFLLKAEIPTKIKNAVTGFSKPTTLEYTQFDVNNIACWFGNNGEIVSYNVTGNSGLEWPKGSGKHAVFQSGFWLAGKVNGDIRTACSEYCSEYTPGNVQYDASVSSPAPGLPNDSKNHLFRTYTINKNDCSDPTSENYNWEYVNWPVYDGAPAHDGEYFTDSNENDIYDTGEEFNDYNLNGNYDAPDGQIEEGQDPPLFLGDQTHWCVFNDFGHTNHKNMYDTDPLGVEVQQALFGFDDNNPLKNVMFVKWLIINKSGNDIDSVYFGIWSDPDIGDASDDYVGCDTLLNLGYSYNCTPIDQTYGSLVPCVGYDLLQGPIVPAAGETAYVSGNILDNYQNLTLTGFYRSLKSAPVFPDPDSADEIYNCLQGLTIGGDVFTNLLTDNSTSFCVPGNPVTREGWEEYDDHKSGGDRRFIMSSGPFDLETWTDTNLDGKPQPGEPGVQEVVTAVIVAAGTDHLNSIDVVKYHSQYAQTLYDNRWQFPQLPSLKVSLSELDKEIILSWYESTEEIESFSTLDYYFEGYNIYQGSNPNGPWKRIETFDEINSIGIITENYIDPEFGYMLERISQHGKDNGIQHQINIYIDSLNNSTPLINNRTYYFAVSAYAYNPDRIPKVIESPKQIIIARPHEPALGQQVLTDTGDELLVENALGISEATITAKVIDPLKLTGETYALRFQEDHSRQARIYDIEERKYIWKNSDAFWYFGKIDPVLPDRPMLDTLVNHKYIFDSIEDTTLDIIDGFQLSLENVLTTPLKFRHHWEQTHNVVETRIDSATYPLVVPGGVDSLCIIGIDTLNYIILCDPPFWVWEWFIIITIDGQDYVRLYRYIHHDIRIEGWASEVGGLNHLASSLGIGGGICDSTLLCSDIELRFTEDGQNASIWTPSDDYQPADTLIHIPFEIWDIERNVQLCAGIADNNHTGGISEPDTNTFDNDWVVILFSDYAETGDSTQTFMDNPNSAWLFYFSSRSKYSIGDTLRIYFTNIVRPGVDEFVFSAPAVDTTLSKSILKKQLKQINVFPNPYFGYNQEETVSGQHFVTFTHLPEKDAVIRIFSLGGQLVRKIIHDNGTPFEYWDLKNRYGKYVASGMYIAHIDVKGVGDKILKIAVLVPG